MNMKEMSLRNQKGFTLIELLIVVAIIAILAAVVFAALDPLRRFQDSRDSSRWHDVTELSSAIQVHQIDNGGYYATSVRNMTTSSVYMIGEGTSGCDDFNNYCDEPVDGDSLCIQLLEYTTLGYIGVIPESPDGNQAWNSFYSGYTLEKTYNGGIKVRSCESENSEEIIVTK